MSFKVVLGDITKQKTDVIVNAANNCLLMGGGVCGAVFKAAGEELLSRECEKIGFCETGSAVITRGFELSKYIIHAVGPVYGIRPETQEQELYSCYTKSLELAVENGAKSVSFPLISSGIYG